MQGLLMNNISENSNVYGQGLLSEENDSGMGHGRKGRRGKYYESGLATATTTDECDQL